MSYRHLTEVADSGVFITPDEPADPRDCARYPDSLYCGGRPFSRKLADLKPKIVNDECAFGIKITPILGFVKLPPVEAYYLKPECRPKDPPLNNDNDQGGAIPPWIPPGSTAIKSGVYIYFNLFFSLDGKVEISNGRIITSFMNPLMKEYVESGKPLYTQRFKAFAEDWMNQFVRPNYPDSEIKGHYIYFLSDPNEPINSPPPARIRKAPPPPPPKKKCNCMGCCPENDPNNGDLEEIKRLLNLLLKRVGEAQPIKIFDTDPNKQGAQAKTLKPKDIAEALKIAIEQVNRANEMIGIDSFPIDAPETIIKPEKSGIWAKVFSFILPDKRRKITSVAELLVWQTEQQAATMGTWHQVIEVEDIDPGKEGKQYKKIVLPNVAETMKESIMLQTEILKSLNLMFDVQLKTLVEASSTKLDAAKAYAVAADIQEYLDYDTKNTVHEVPIQIQLPGKDLTQEEEANLVRLLQPSKHKVVTEEWTGKHAFSEVITDLLQAARMISANFFSRQ